MSDKYTLVHEGLNRWINSPNNGGECCQTCSDTVDELNRLLDRIMRLEEFVGQLTNPKFTRDDLPKEALLQRIKRLEEVGDEVVINYVNSLSAFEMWRKAKEDKP